MKVIEKLLEEKPDTQFDAVFAAKLKEKILAEATQEAVKEEISINGEIALSVEKDISSTQEVASENSIARKGRKFFEKVRTLFSNKVFLSGLSASMAAFILLAGWYIYDLRTGVPEVVAGNWSFEYRKIPYDEPSLDLTF